MYHLTLKQIFGAFFVMGLFLSLLIFASKVKDETAFTPTLSSNLSTTLSKPLDQTGEYKNPPTPGNIISGSFNPNGQGNVVYHDEKNKERKFHYKAIRSDKLLSKDLKPALKLETDENGTQIWKNVDWAWIDYDQGILYFYYKTQENSGEIKPDNYTGNYQLVLQTN